MLVTIYCTCTVILTTITYNIMQLRTATRISTIYSYASDAAMPSYRHDRIPHPQNNIYNTCIITIIYIYNLYAAVS